MKKITLLILAVTYFASCSESKKNQTIVVGSTYSIELPDFMTKSYDLNEEASLQYQNTIRELYAIIIDEQIEDLNYVLEEYGLTDLYSNDLNGYVDLLLEDFLNSVNAEDVSEVQDLKLNGLKAKIIDFNGEVDETKVYYNVAFIEGKERYYQIIVWTLSDRKAKHKEIMKNIVNSFKEI
jgi:hypothetical protein